jgi:hypothetical protein
VNKKKRLVLSLTPTCAHAVSMQNGLAICQQFFLDEIGKKFGAFASNNWYFLTRALQQFPPHSFDQKTKGQNFFFFSHSEANKDKYFTNILYCVSRPTYNVRISVL